MALRSEKYWLLDYDAITIYRLWNPVRKRVHISRDMIFNETELIRNINVKGLSQNIIAFINITITNMFTENKEDESIAARIRKTIFKIELLKEAVEIIKVSAKFIDVVASRRNSNIVYEDLIEENSILLKVMIIKAIFNKDKPSYETAMANLEIF
jgi:hypothetical protein